ncbi:hypothetical protein SARC_01328, partial [Sphaeroforma arctica JP610]
RKHLICSNTRAKDNHTPRSAYNNPGSNFITRRNKGKVIPQAGSGPCGPNQNRNIQFRLPAEWTDMNDIFSYSPSRLREPTRDCPHRKVAQPFLPFENYRWWNRNGRYSGYQCI